MVKKTKPTKKRASSSAPLRSSKVQRERSLKSAKYVMNYSLPSDVRDRMRKIVKMAKAGYDSKKLYSTKGVYLPSRLKVHNKIIGDILKQDTSTDKPDVYVFGGVAGSGKSTVLPKYVREKALTINNDEIKLRLSKYDKSPFKNYPLLHASWLHEESSDLEKKLLHRAVALRKDIILDRTLASYIKNKNILQDMHKKGYSVTMLGTNLYPHIALIRASARFLKNGRYVPLDIIAQKGNATNSSVLKMAKQKFVKKARVYDTTKKKPRLMYRRG